MRNFPAIGSESMQEARMERRKIQSPACRSLWTSGILQADDVSEGFFMIPLR
jgi:hypothetical protein